ncbi:MAG: TonB-dependent receptor [Terracidiphilus sp.]
MEFRSRAGFGQCRIRPTLLAAMAFYSMLFTAAPWLSAQVAYGVNGTVTDSSGAVIPGAQVAVRADATGVVTNAVSSPAGAFTIMLSNTGSYSVTVNAPGFKQFVEKSVGVEVGMFSTVVAKLQPGATTETVQVTAQEIAMNTADPGIGTTIEPELVSAAPIEVNGGPRQIDSFVLQTPGTSAPPSAAGTGIEGSALSINGGITAESSYYYNGIPITQAFTANVSESGNAYPPYEMVSEARVASATFSAQYGLAAGAVTYKMAGGANTYHGDAFFNNRNNFFDSVGFFNGPAWGGSNKAPTNHQTNYGFTLSGPASIPHLYNGKDRTFFLFTLDWYGQHGAQTAFHTLPTAAELNGDFSNFLDANGNLVTIFDPLTGQQFQCNGKPNAICPSRFSTVSKSLLPLLQPSSPLRTGTGTYNGEQDNEAPYVKSTTNYNHNWGFTMDHNLTASQNIHFSLWNQNVNSPSPGNNMFPNSNELSSATVNQTSGRGYLLNYIKMVSPNLVVTAGVNKTDIYYNNHVVNQSADFAAITNAVSFPGINFIDGAFPVTDWGNHSSRNSTRRYDNAFVNNWLWTKGKHTFNIGGEFRRTLEDSLICRTCGGDFNFSHKQTADPNNFNSNTTGNAFASFLLGDVISAERNWALPADLRNLAVSSYIQDDYKFSPRLTINAGLRWDIPVPFTAKQNDITFANFNMPNAGADNLLGALTKLGSCAVGCSGINRAAIHWKDLGPRFGFSYQVNNKTVVQGGYYLAFMGGGAYAFALGRVAQDYTNVLAGSYQSPTGSNTTPGFGNWDSNVISNPQQIPFTPTMGNGQMVRQMDPKTAGISPYTQSWSFNIQRELPDNMFLMLAYIGNRDIHLPSSLNQPNMLDPKYLALGNVLNDTVDQIATDPAAIAAGIKIPYTNFVNDYGGDPTSISIIQAMLPYPQFGGTDNHFDQAGTSFYRSLQAQVQKRFTHGLAFLSSLTLAQNWSDVDFGVTLQQNNAQNPQNQKAEWSVSSLNQKWNDKNMFTYVLPIGAGQRFLSHSGLADEILGGWQVAGIMNYSTGNPLGIYENTNNVVLYTNANGDAQPRPNIVPGQARKTYSYSRTRDYFVGKTPVQPVQFNTNAFSLAGQFTFGNAARNYIGITAPPNLMENFDAMKTFHIGERVKATLRVDYFNAFNRTQFGSKAPPVDNTIEDSTFGMVQGTSSNISNRQGQATLRITF